MASNASSSSSSSDDVRLEAADDVEQQPLNQPDVESGGTEASKEQSAPKADAAAAAAADHENSAQAARKKAAFAVVFWLTMSCIQILFNKMLFSGPFRYPVTLTAIHMSFASVMTFVLRVAGFIEVPPLPGGWRFFVRNFLLISCLFAAALASGNVAAARLSVSFVHILKAITPIVTLSVGIAFGIQKPCMKQGVIVTLVSAGVVIASFGELSFDATGLVLQLVAVLTESTRLVIMQRLLQQYLPKSSPLVTLSLFAPVAAVLLIGLSLAQEPGGYALALRPDVMPLIALNTASAFTLNIAVMLLVGATSGLTLVLAGIIKDIIVIVASMFLFSHPMTPIQTLGYFLALFGLSLYDTYKANEDKALPELVRLTLRSPRMGAIVVAVALLGVLSLKMNK